MSGGSREEERARNLDELAQAIRARSSGDPDFNRAVGAMEEDLSYILNALRSDPETWRLNRAFHTVHVPSFLAIVSMMRNIDDMNSVTGEERLQIYEAIHRAGQLVSDARHDIERVALHKAMVRVQVLAQQAPPAAQPFEKASFYDRALGGIKSASKSSLNTVSSGATALPNVVGRAKDSMASSLGRVSAVPLLAANLQKTLSGVISDNVTKPIQMRLQAGEKALKYGVGAGVGIGVVTAVLFPPLLPISAGGAVLAAMRGWRTEMEAARKLNEAEREKRLSELKAERSAALLHLTNGASSFQMETDEMNLTVDVDTGEAEAVILKGKHTGRSWSDLDVAEKAEVVSILTESTEVILDILNFGKENL